MLSPRFHALTRATLLVKIYPTSGQQVPVYSSLIASNPQLPELLRSLRFCEDLLGYQRKSDLAGNIWNVFQKTCGAGAVGNVNKYLEYCPWCSHPKCFFPFSMLITISYFGAAVTTVMTIAGHVGSQIGGIWGPHGGEDRVELLRSW